MENEIKQWRLPPNCVRPRFRSKPPAGSQEMSPELSNSSRKRKTAPLSSVYHPQPRSPLGIMKPSLELELGFSEWRGDFPVKQKKCNCKQSLCLKMYCWCFASGQYCNGCSCFDCQNTPVNEGARQGALGRILERNSKSLRKVIFGPKFSAPSKDGRKEDIILVNVGCCCKRSRCIQGYCDCYHANKFCSKSCKCKNCENYGSCNGKSSNAPKECEDEQNFLGFNRDDPVNSKIDQSWKVVRQGTPRSLNFTRRSLTADISPLQNLMEFCKLLIGTSAVLTDLKVLHKQELQNKGESERKDYQISRPGNLLNCNEDEEHCPDFNSDDFLLKERPASPEIASSTHDKKDVMSTADASSCRIQSNGCFSEAYMEQETLILAKFRDFLICLIACGR